VASPVGVDHALLGADVVLQHHYTKSFGFRIGAGSLFAILNGHDYVLTGIFGLDSYDATTRFGLHAGILRLEKKNSILFGASFGYRIEIVEIIAQVNYAPRPYFGALYGSIGFGYLFKL
jgi:hypothetical protein